MQSVKNLLKKRFALLTMVVVMMTGTIIPGYVETAQADTTVYVTRTGARYHTHKCGNGTYYAASRSSAIARGLTPCQKCFPNGDRRSTASSSSSAKRTPVVVKKMELNKAELELVKGQSAALKVRNAPGKVSWSCSDTAVAAVSAAGKVTAKAKGTVTITATSGSQSKRCKVRVEEPKLNHTTLTMDLKDVSYLKLSGCKHAVKWYSDDSDIVKVSQGKLTAKDVGKTTIRAKVHGKTYSCRVTVKKPGIERITVSDYDTVMYTEDWQDVGINVRPAYALDYYPNISVKSSDSSVVSAEWYEGWDGAYVELISGEMSGSATITVSVGGQSVSFTVNVKAYENTEIPEVSDMEDD